MAQIALSRLSTAALVGIAESWKADRATTAAQTYHLYHVTGSIVAGFAVQSPRGKTYRVDVLSCNCPDSRVTLPEINAELVHRGETRRMVVCKHIEIVALHQAREAERAEAERAERSRRARAVAARKRTAQTCDIESVTFSDGRTEHLLTQDGDRYHGQTFESLDAAEAYAGARGLEVLLYTTRDLRD